MSTTFAQVRNSALNLEIQTESLLSRYSRMLSTIAAEQSSEEALLVTEIASMLTNREGVVANLNRKSEMEPNLPRAKLQQLQRHKEVLADHKASFTTLQSKFAAERNRSNLLYLIRLDLTAHKQRSLGNDNNDNDYILDEARRVEGANSFADRLLQQAYETRDQLFGQRALLQSAQARLLLTLLQVPGIGALIGKINTRRKRDSLILAAVITLCIVGLFYLG